MQKGLYTAAGVLSALLLSTGCTTAVKRYSPRLPESNVVDARSMLKKHQGGPYKFQGGKYEDPVFDRMAIANRPENPYNKKIRFDLFSGEVNVGGQALELKDEPYFFIFIEDCIRKRGRSYNCYAVDLRRVGERRSMERVAVETEDGVIEEVEDDKDLELIRGIINDVTTYAAGNNDKRRNYDLPDPPGTDYYLKVLGAKNISDMIILKFRPLTPQEFLKMQN